jgi:ribulose-5-phosphate 4-epimerase/fuculose-1-phosphate aldolase
MMNLAEATQAIQNAAAYFERQGAGYQNWGRVEVLQIAIKISATEFVASNENKSLQGIKASDITCVNNPGNIFQQIFKDRKNVQVILITQQQYASEITREIPPILDDQAQLLGVSVRVAQTEAGILKALNGRYAAIIPGRKSICLGAGMDEAYVAAQLLEKAAKTYIEAAALGGAKPINRIEAWLMQQYYQFKYSKEASKNR